MTKYFISLTFVILYILYGAGCNHTLKKIDRQLQSGTFINDTPNANYIIKDFTEGVHIL